MSRSGTSETIFRSTFSIGAIAKGTALSFVITLLGAGLLGIAVSLTEWEGFTQGLGGFTYVSIALGGILAARHSQKYGWLHGAIVGLIYHVLATMFFQPDFSFAHMGSGPWLIGCSWSLVAGAIGGVLGVNS